MYYDIALIDADFIIYYTASGKKVLGENGEYKREEGRLVYEDKTWEEVRSDIDNLITVILRRLKVKWYIGALTEGKCFRYDIYPEYKGNRKKLVKPKWFSEAKQYLFEKWKFMAEPYLEADDIVNIYKKRLSDKYRCIIVSPDKDILSLEGTHFDPKHMKFVDTTKEEAIYKFWTDMIVGQPSDFVKGVEGLGEVYTKKLFGDSTATLTYPQLVLDTYINKYGEYNGILRFYESYRCLKILDEDFKLLNDTELIEYIKEEVKEENV